MTKYHTSKGAVHIHTTFSDGTASIEEISKQAKKSGLDWIIITDHNTMKIKEGFYNGTAVIAGEEITPENSNHYLAFGIDKEVMPYNNPQIFIDKVRAQGGFGFSAHPDESDKRKNSAPPLKWTDKNITGDGVELWNWFSDWADNMSSENVFYSAYAYFFKHKFIKGPENATLKWWDDINAKRDDIFPAIAGIDAHALIIKKYGIPLKIFPYKQMFDTLCNSVYFLEPPNSSFADIKRNILNALKAGNNVMFNRHILDETPLIYAENSQRTAFSGDIINFDENTRLFVKPPKKTLIKIYLNGEKISETKDFSLDFKINSKGKYRVEMYYKNEPYAFSNPISVR